MYNRYWGRDRRRYHRINLNLTVWYEVVSSNNLSQPIGAIENEAVTLDISPLGMAFLSKHQLPQWTLLKIKFVFFGSKDTGFQNLAIPVEVSAEVRSCTPCENNEFRLGICFKGLEQEKKNQLIRFVQESSRAYIS